FGPRPSQLAGKTWTARSRARAASSAMESTPRAPPETTTAAAGNDATKRRTMSGLAKLLEPTIAIRRFGMSAHDTAINHGRVGLGLGGGHGRMVLAPLTERTAVAARCRQ